MSGPGWTHRGKTYDSPADVIEELVTDRDKWKALAEKYGDHAMEEIHRVQSHMGGLCETHKKEPSSKLSCVVCMKAALVFISTADPADVKDSFWKMKRAASDALNSVEPKCPAFTMLGSDPVRVRCTRLEGHGGSHANDEIFLGDITWREGRESSDSRDVK